MKEFMGMILCLAVIVLSVWSAVILFAAAVEFAASSGVHPELLYFVSGVVTGLWYKEIGRAFMSYSEVVFQKVHDWIIWR